MAEVASSTDPKNPPRVVFLIGAPRSGTTWLQTLLGSHDDVVTPQETDLFSTLVAPLQNWWDEQLGRSLGDQERRRAKGLAAVLDDAEFSGLMSGVIGGVFDAISALDPTASVIVEKSPSHSQHVNLIAKYMPTAQFVHIVRDGRDVVTSLQAASQGWGNHWAPSAPKRGALMWQRNVQAALTAAATDRYIEIKYEDLRAGDPEPLQGAFASCGLDVDRAQCASLLDEYSLTRMAEGAASSPIAVGGTLSELSSDRNEPQGFFGKGATGGSTASWSSRERLLFDAIAGDLLIQLGYEVDHAWAGSSRARAMFAKRAAAARLMGRIGRRLGSRLTKRSERLLAKFP